MKKALLILFLCGVTGLALYYLKPDIIKSVSNSLNAIQLPLPDFAGDMEITKGGKLSDGARNKKQSPVKCVHCKDGKMRCSACSGTGIPNNIVCYSCGKAAVTKYDELTDSRLVYCPHCKLTLGRRSDLKCKFCDGTGIMTCPYCGGTGFVTGKAIPASTVSCTVCNRTGMVDCPKMVTMKRRFISSSKITGKGARVREGGADDMITVICPVCGGKGRKKCPECGGKCYIVLQIEKTAPGNRR